MKSSSAKTDVINSLMRGLAILEAVAAQKGGASAKQISLCLNLKLGTCYHLLNSLVEAGYLLKNEENQKFYVSYRIPFLNNLFLENHSLLPLLKPYLVTLANETGETVGLAIREGLEIFIADMIEGQQPVKIGKLHIGYRDHCYARALGKPVLAFLKEEELEGHLQKHPIVSLRPTTVKNREELDRELETIRKQGYCIDNQEFIEDVCAVGAPIFDYSGRPVASFSVALPASRFEDRRLDVIHQITAQSLLASKSLGFTEISYKEKILH